MAPDPVLGVLQRAARRTASPAGQASVQSWLLRRQSLMAVPLPPLPDGGGPPLRLATGETWCRHCGAALRPNERCCSRPDPVPAVQILRTGEYMLRA